MNKIVNLSITRKTVPVRMDVVQYATSPDITFVLEDYTPNDGATARIYIEKPSGSIIYNDCTINGNEVIYTPTTQSFAEVGVSECQLEIVEDDKVAISFLIYAHVSENIIDSEAVESTDEFTALQDALATVTGYDERITENTDNISALEAWQQALSMTSTNAVTTTTNPIHYKVSSIDAYQEDNGVSSVMWPTTARILDANNKIVQCTEGIVNPDGRLGFSIYANNYKLDGSKITGPRIEGNVTKNGTISYNVNNPSAFKTAIQAVPRTTFKAGDKQEITTTSNTSLTSISHTTATGRFFVLGRAVIKTSKNTSNVYIMVGSTRLNVASETNLTTPITVNPCGVFNGTAGATYTVDLRLETQDSSTTGTSMPYNRPILFICDLP